MAFAVKSGSLPAQVVGVRQVCGELDLSIQLLYSHDVFWTLIPHFTGPEDETTSEDDEKDISLKRM